MDEERRDESFGSKLSREIRDHIHDHVPYDIRDRIMDKRERRLNRMRYRSPAGGIIFGGLIVAVGLLLLLDNMGIIQARDFWRYWPVFLIFFGIAKIAENWRPGGILVGGGIALLGVLFLLENFDIIAVNFSVIWPLLIILAGLAMLWNAVDRRRGSPSESGLPGQAAAMGGEGSLIAIFSGHKRRYDSREFRGVDIVAIFGGVQVDLRGAKIAPDQPAVIDITAVFGGIEIDAPENCRVTVKGAPIFGAFEDKTRAPVIVPGVPVPELIVTGTAVFGGVTIR